VQLLPEKVKPVHRAVAGVAGGVAIAAVVQGKARKFPRVSQPIQIDLMKRSKPRKRLKLSSRFLPLKNR
jgi:hypothetical protein